MGTNYYVETECCPACKRPGAKLHIGKSSAGWCFALHVDADEGINSLEDWQHIWSAPGSRIVDEYGREHTAEDMLRTITQRVWKGETPKRQTDTRFCVGHGSETYDLVVGEFS